MKQFLKYTLASFTGFFLALFLLVVFFLFIIFGLISSLDKVKEQAIPANSVLHLKLDYPVMERSDNNPFRSFQWKSFSSISNLGLNDITANLRKAKADPNIKGVFLDVNGLQAGMATITELRNSILDFRKSGKFVYAYSENYTLPAYYLASSAEKICLNPVGELEFKGLKAELIFFKKLLDKLAIEPQIIRHGKYKSAVEVFIQEKMSPESRQQMSEFIHAIWNNMLRDISESRKIAVSQLKLLAEGRAEDTEEVVKAHLADTLIYYDQFLKMLEMKAKAGMSKKHLVTLSRYNEVPDPANSYKNLNQVAVIYAYGNILDGKGDDENISSVKLAETIRKAAADNHIRSIVLRVNSPGGSALASEVIWRELFLARQKKPLIVSMGDYAASGGYYISCPADVIVAQPTTLTGSIGVFGVIPNFKNFLSEKIGITTDTVKTNSLAGFPSVTRSLTAAERQLMERKIDKIYSIFIRRVAEGRKRTVAYIDSIAQGRVWVGSEAVKIGLADSLGGLDKAVAIAAKRAGLKDFSIVELPAVKDPFTRLLEGFSGNAEKALAQHHLGGNYKYFQQMEKALKMEGVQALMPFYPDFY